MLVRPGELSDAWIDGDETARWRSGTAHGPDQGAVGTGSSLLEVDAGCRLPRHTDSAEEVVIVLVGAARAVVGEEERSAARGELVLIPADVPHEVHNDGDGTLRFLALYAGTDVVTTYEQPVQPGGESQRRPLG